MKLFLIMIMNVFFITIFIPSAHAVEIENCFCDTFYKETYRFRGDFKGTHYDHWVKAGYRWAVYGDYPNGRKGSLVDQMHPAGHGVSAPVEAYKDCEIALETQFPECI